MARKKKPPPHRCNYLNIQNILACSVCGKEAFRINILESSLRRSGFTKASILEYYNMTKEQAKDFFVYTFRRSK